MIFGCISWRCVCGVTGEGRRAHLAGSEDLEHERQAVRDQLLGVLLLLDAAELFEQTLDQRSAVLVETCAQGLHPGVQSPRDPWEMETGVNT